jgi:hypothetical protein
MLRGREVAAASSTEMSGVGVGRKQTDGGGAFSLFHWSAVKRKGQGSKGGRRHCGGGKKNKFTPASIFIPQE